MTVNISKPSVNVREKLAELDKPSGIAGEAVLRADSVQEIRNQIGAGRKNLLINGSVQIWQRGTSQTATNGYHNLGPDHMTTYYGGTYSQQFVTLPNGQYVSALRYTANSSTNASPNFNWIIEDSGKFLRSQTVTISWWMRASKSGIDMATRVNNVANSRYAGGGSNYTLGTTSGYIYRATTEWTHHSKVIQMPSTNTHDHGLAEIWSTSSSMSNTDWFEVTQVQLELGSVATDFEHRSYGEELALCQRFYEVCYVWQQGQATAASQYVAAGSAVYAVTKRALPSLTSTAGGFGSSVKITVTSRNITVYGFGLQGISTTSGEIFSDTKVVADAEL